MNYASAIVNEKSNIRDAIEAIDRSSFQITLVVDAKNKLIGTVTDGDVRRGILKGIGMDQSVTLIMNMNPITGRSSDTREDLISLMVSRGIRQIPILDENGVLVGLELFQVPTDLEKRSSIAVIMAGGVGKRLGELTKQTPKPMLNVKSRPLLESIVLHLKNFRFNEIYISVNYKRSVIKDYFGDGSKHGVKISYLEESTPLGTAGSLSLLPIAPKEPFLLMNADLVTNINIDSLFEFHQKHNPAATTCVREYEFKVPYGVVRVGDDNNVSGLDEKPTMKFFVGAGIYVLDPKIVQLVPKNERLDMPELLEAIMQTGQKVSAFPMRETWVDIGHREDFDRVNKD